MRGLIYFWIPFQLRVGHDRSSSTLWVPVCSECCWHRKEPLNPVLRYCFQNFLPDRWCAFCKLLYCIPHNLRRLYLVYCYYLCIFVWETEGPGLWLTHTPYVCEGQRPTFRNQFSLSTKSSELWGLNLGHQACTRTIYRRSHLTDLPNPWFFFF